MMKLMKIKDIEGFFKMVDSCEGSVYLVGDGLRLNLKSKLAQYFSLAEIFSGGEEIPELELDLENPADINKLIAFAIG